MHGFRGRQGSTWLRSLRSAKANSYPSFFSCPLGTGRVPRLELVNIFTAIRPSLLCFIRLTNLRAAVSCVVFISATWQVGG